MWKFHLSYDAVEDVLEKVVVFLCGKGVRNIGHPVESTLVFALVDNDNTALQKLRTGLVAKFPTGFYFVLSRVSRAEVEKKKTVDMIVAKVESSTKAQKSHEDAFDDVLKKLKEEKKITNDVKNFRAPF